MCLLYILKIYCSRSVVFHTASCDYAVSCYMTEVENEHFTLKQNARLMALCLDSQVKNWTLNRKPITEKTLQIETKLKPKYSPLLYFGFFV